MGHTPFSGKVYFIRSTWQELLPSETPISINLALTFRQLEELGEQPRYATKKSKIHVEETGERRLRWV